jgi:predicted ATPase/DNA-binding CsgD family transcriptional regulator
VATEVGPEQLGGLCWVDLGPITDRAHVARAVAAAAGVRLDPLADPLQVLVAQLRDLQSLICLDTCEHLLDACADLVDTLLRKCPDITVLATSREPLGVPGEVVWRVPPLAQSEAVRLFGDRAALVRTGFDLDEERDAVHAVCARLEGVPLGIELAAAWVRMLTPAEVASRLDERLALLIGGSRVVPNRHQTLAASIAWSYDLLDEADRVLLRRLSVFVGGFTVDRAQAVCFEGPTEEIEVLAAIRRLVDKSLVVAADTAVRGRYRLLDTIREYAEGQLRTADELAATQDRHLEHFLAVVEAAEFEFERDQDRWRLLFDTEYDNVRAALRHGLAAPDAERGRRLAAALARYWGVCGHTQEALEFLGRAIKLAPDERSALQARLWWGFGNIASGAGRPEVVADAAERGLAIAKVIGDDRHRARCLNLAAYSKLFTDFQASHILACEAEQYGLIARDPVAVDLARVLKARTLTNQDRHVDAVGEIRAVLERTTKRGERKMSAFALGIEVWAALFTGKLHRAEELARDGLRLAEPLGSYFAVGHMSFNLAWVLGLTGKINAGRELIHPIIRSVTDARDEVGLLSWFALVPGKLSLWAGDLHGAVRWFESAAQFGAPNTDNWVAARALPGLARAMRRLGRTEQAHSHANRAVDLATTLNIPHVRAEALEELAFLAAADQDLSRAEDLHREALLIRENCGLRTFYVDSIDAFARAWVAGGRFAEAARLLAASDTGRTSLGYPRPPIDQASHAVSLRTVRRELGDTAFADYWGHGAKLSLDEAVSYAIRRSAGRQHRQRPFATGWTSLTPTERSVVDLVVTGLSNPQISSRLFMSRSTVKTHLAHIYRKLHIANRTELAAFAQRHK